MKTMMKILMSMIVLFLITGCRGRLPDEYKNEIVRSLVWLGQGETMYYIEKKDPQALENKSVFLWYSPPMLQVYRIEGQAVTQCSFVTNRTLAGVVEEECRPAFMAIRQLPNILNQDKKISPTFGENYLTMVNMQTGLWVQDSPFAKGMIEWHGQWVRKWRGGPDDAPVEIETFYQSLTRAISSPEHKRGYRAYLRAIPLFTAEEQEKEKDTPIIDLKETRYHARYICGQSPC